MKSKTLDQIKKEARSESMNKWIGRIEEETDVLSVGNTPTERMEDLIDKLKSKIDLGGNSNKEINDLILSAFEKGVQSGFSKALVRFGSGSITTKKKRGENYYDLYSNSIQYQITDVLPAADGDVQKATVRIKLSDHGFSRD